MTTKDHYQTDTRPTTAKQIMLDLDFRAGFADARAGRPPRFDEFSHTWSYDRGRQFAVVASLGLKLFLGEKLNPKALKEFQKFLYGDGGL